LIQHLSWSSTPRHGLAIRSWYRRAIQRSANTTPVVRFLNHTGRTGIVCPSTEMVKSSSLGRSVTSSSQIRAPAAHKSRMVHGIDTACPSTIIHPSRREGSRKLGPQFSIGVSHKALLLDQLGQTPAPPDWIRAELNRHHLKLIWGIPASRRHDGRGGILPLTRPTTKRAAQAANLRQSNNAETCPSRQWSEPS